MPHRNHTPAYRLHKQSGQAIVTFPDGLGGRRDFTLGEYNSLESRAEYARLLAEWEANGRCLPQLSSPATSDTSINELILDYWRWAEQHYRDEEGNPGRELENVRAALRPLRQLYGHTPARQFGPLALRALQEEMARSGLCRTTINARINRVRRFFKWAVSFERLPPAVHQALKDVPGLQWGRGTVRESDPVGSVPAEVVEASLPFLPAPVAAMVRLQLLTGCRPGEVMRMRAVDLNTSGPVWEYRPAHHKNKHRGLDRVIFLGAQAQEVVRPFLKTDLHAYLFSPREYVESLHARRAQKRKTKRTPSELRRKRKAKPRRKPADRYNRRSYRVAITRAVDKANAKRAEQGLPPLPPWSPLQLRHTAATLIRSKYGVEAAQVTLGHTRVETTQIYAERDLTRAAQIAAEIG
jgi:integrase